MIAEMSYYDELKDHDAPPSKAMGPGISGTRSEMSLNLDDLDEMRGSLHRRSRASSGSGSPNSSNLSLSSWIHEQEATTGNLTMLGGSSLAGYWRASSLDSVKEQDHDDNSDDDEYTSNADGSFRKNIVYTRPRRNSADEDETSFLPAFVESTKSTSNSFVRSQFWNGCLLDGSLSQLNLGEDEVERTGKRVHFEVPARLEDVREFEKPDLADYNNLYYMGQELQMMYEEAVKEEGLARHVLR